jgi:ubiquinone/menaquinone biosynthesis C-methylase UbiE
MGDLIRPGQYTQEVEAQEAARAVWGSSPAGTTSARGMTPGSREFFERARAFRSQREMPWLEELLEFARFRGRDVLEIGCGAGFDAFAFVSKGARYVGIDLVPANIERTLSHLALEGLEADVRVAAAEHLPFEDGTFDVVYSNGVLHHLADPRAGLAEAVRVMRPGGELWVVVYNRSSAFYWLNLVLYRYLLRGGFRRGPLGHVVSGVEFTTSGVLPVVHTFTRTSLRDALEALGLDVAWIVSRKLLHEDLPAGPFRSLWRRVPQRWLDILARRFGWYLVAKSRKPG